MADSPNMAPTPSILGGLPLAASQMQAAPAAAMTLPGSNDPLTGQAISRLAASQQMIDRMQQLGQQSAAIPLPQTSVMQAPWMKMQSPAGKGFLGGLNTVMADVGRGALAGVAATAPGRAVQQGVYGPGERRYAMQKGNIAQQIQGLQESAQLEQQPVGALGELAWHRDMITERGRHDVATEKLGQERADTAAFVARANQQHHANMEVIANSNLELKDKIAQLVNVYHQGLLANQQKAIDEHWDQSQSDLADKDLRDSYDRLVAFVSAHPIATAMGAVTPPSPSGVTPVTPKQTGYQKKQQTSPSQFKVGQMVNIKGKSMKVTAVHPDGSFDAQ